MEKNDILPQFRVGTGFDVHAFAPGRRLILCGVDIPHHCGLLGHSDADVALHALSDALLGAAALHDIGFHFPDSDPAYRGIDSGILLCKVHDLLLQKSYKISNIDITIIAQAPKLSPYIDLMRRNIAYCLGLDNDAVSVKATTTEHLGFTGRGEGIAAQATVLIYR